MSSTLLSQHPTFCSAVDLFRSGRSSPRDYLEACIDSIEQVEPAVKALAYIDLEAARLQADQASERYRAGTPLSPVDGMPVGIKDIIATAQMPTEMNSVLYKGHYPKVDAAAVRALREGGGVLVGKTVTTEFAISRSGPTANPHDLTRTPGGSSSGSAAGTASGMFAAALGTQTQGSLIRPASFCGVVGYKPTHRALSLDGVHPLSASHDHLGVLADSVTDAWWLARWVSDCVPAQDSYGLAGPLYDIPPASVPNRLAVLRTRGFEELDDDSNHAFEEALQFLRKTGIDIVEPSADPELRALVDLLCDVPDLSIDMVSYEMRWPFLGYLSKHPDQLGPRIHELMEKAKNLSRDRYRKLLRYRDDLRRFWSTFSSSYDAFVLPSSSGPAPAGLDFTGTRTLPVYSSFVGAPAYGLPVMQVKSLPFGMQLVGFSGADYRLTCIAQWVMQNFKALGQIA